MRSYRDPEYRRRIEHERFLAAIRRVERELGRGTTWNKRATFGLCGAVAATLVTLIVTHCDTTQLIHETKIASETAHKDSADALGRISQQADEAAKQATIAQADLIANSRPWIKAEDLKIKSVQFGLGDKPDTLALITNFTYKNIGHSPAKNIAVNKLLLTDPTAVWEYQLVSVCDKNPLDIPIGPTLFPNDTGTAAPFSQPPSVVGDMWAAKIPNFNTTKFIGIDIPICISYRFDGSSDLHGTSIIYRVNAKYHCAEGDNKSCGNMFETSKGLFKEDEIEVTPLQESIRAN